MSFISYAQNYEDVMLWRALKDVKNGFYIDIGANDPEIDSVTKAFYDRGWSGLNCEPVKHWFDKLQAQRQRDINIQIAIGADNTELEFYEVVNSGLSTLNKNTAQAHAKKLGFEVINYTVAVKTLTSLCEEHKISNIHFLKIDVEGAEKSVLEGIDFHKLRPWIIVIEATKPMSQNIDYEDWEYLITSKNYHFVYFDGLNRFYVADEYRTLDSAFSTPPNVFDRFILSSEVKVKEEKDKWWASADEATKWAKENEKKYNTAIEERDKWWQTADEATQWAKENEKKLQQTQILLDEMTLQFNILQNTYDTVTQSLSWKLTKPFRFSLGKLKKFWGENKNENCN